MKKFSLIICLFFSCAFAFAAGISVDTPISELNGKKIGVQTAVLYEELVREKLPDTQFVYFTMPNDMILALKSGRVSAYLVEEVGYGVEKLNCPELETLDETAGSINASCILGNNGRQERLLRELNEYIGEYRADGTFGKMYSYWIENYDPVNNTCDTDVPNGENGRLAVAVEGGYEPFSYIRNGEICGFDVDFICRFCRKYGYVPDFYEIPFEAIAPGVETGKYDIGMNIVVSEERNETGVLTDNYYSCPVVMVILGDKASPAGFFEKIRASFNKTFIREGRWKMFASGAGITVLINILSIMFGTLVGFALFIWCRKGKKIANWVTSFFLWLIHGMPTVLLLMILYYIVFGPFRTSGVTVSIIGFTLIFGCAMFDMLRVGYKAIPKGQFEASRALGYTDAQCFFKIILPQAASHFLPIYRNEIVTLIKETSVVGYIAVLDLTKISDLIRSRTYEAFFPLIFTAVMYFAIAGIMIRIVRIVEVKIDPRMRPEEKILKGIRQVE